MGKQRDQFRRMLRYLKRWKHRRFDAKGHSEPSSIGLNLIALDNFIYYEEDDLSALIHIVDSIVNSFRFEGIDKDGDFLYRIKSPLPIELDFELNSDVFEKMSDRQMTDFKEKAEKLQSDLNGVENETDEHEKYKNSKRYLETILRFQKKKRQQRNNIIIYQVLVLLEWSNLYGFEFNKK